MGFPEIINYPSCGVNIFLGYSSHKNRIFLSGSPKQAIKLKAKIQFTKITALVPIKYRWRGWMYSRWHQHEQFCHWGR